MVYDDISCLLLQKFTHKNAKLNQPLFFVTSYSQISQLAKINLSFDQALVKLIWAIFKTSFIFGI